MQASSAREARLMRLLQKVGASVVAVYTVEDEVIAVEEA